MKLPMLPGQQVPVEPRSLPLANPGAASLAPAELGEEAERDSRTLYFSAREAAFNQRQEEERNAAIAGSKVMAQARLDMTKGLLSAQQSASPGAPGFTPAYLKTFDDYAATAIKSAPEIAQPYVSQRMTLLRSDLANRAIGFEAHAILAKRENDLKDTVALQSNTLRSDPGQFEGILGEALGAVKAAGLGADREPAAESFVRNELARSLLEGENERDPQRAQQLLNGGAFDDYLQPGVKNELLRGNQQELDRLQAESDRQQRANEVALQAKVQGLYSDERAQILDGGYGQGLLTPQMINQAYPAERYGGLAQRMISRLDRDKADYASMQKTALTSPAEDQALLAKMAPAGADYADQMENRNKAEALLTKKYAAIAADPAGYVLHANPDVQQAWDAASSDPSKIASAIALSQATQARLGVPSYQQRVLSVPQAQAAAGRLSSAAPDAAGQMLQDLTHQYGGQWTTAFGEIAKAGLPSAYQDLAAIDDPAARTAFAQALKAGPKLPELLAPGDKKTIDGAVEDALQPFLRTLSPAGAQRAASLQQSAKTLAYLYASRGQSANGAANAAVRGMSGQYDIADGPGFNARVPRGSLSAVEGYADHLLDTLTPADVLPPGTPPARGVVTPGNIDIFHRPIAKNADGSTTIFRPITIMHNAVLIPSVDYDGRLLTSDEATALYRETGHHFGVFKTAADANSYAQTLQTQGAQLQATGEKEVPLTPDQRGEVYFRDAVAHGSTWISNPRDDGWQLLDQQQRPVLRADGTPLGFTFADVANAPPTVVPDQGAAANLGEQVPP